MQPMLVEADPERLFVPPYVGHRGRLGMRLDRALDWDELSGIVEDAYAEVAPPKLVEPARAAAAADFRDLTPATRGYPRRSPGLARA
jgi:hypothetical protein